MIKNQLELSDEVTVVSQRLDALESGLQTLIKGQDYIIRTLNHITKKEKSHSVKKPPAQKLQSKQRKYISS